MTTPADSQFRVAAESGGTLTGATMFNSGRLLVVIPAISNHRCKQSLTGPCESPGVLHDPDKQAPDTQAKRVIVDR